MPVNLKLEVKQGLELGTILHSSHELVNLVELDGRILLMQSLVQFMEELSRHANVRIACLELSLYFLGDGSPSVPHCDCPPICHINPSSVGRVFF